MRRVIQDFGKLRQLIRERGLAHAGNFGLLAIRGRLMRRVDEAWARQWGLDLVDHTELDHFEISSPNKTHGFAYGPSSRLSMSALLSNVPGDLRNFTFVDYGSGDGRMLLAASAFPFRAIVGVEFARDLHEVAVRNVGRVYPQPNECPISCLHVDATEFTIPAGPCVFYFCNPFREPVFSKVLDNIERACAEDPRPMYLLYQQVIRGLEDAKSTNVSLMRRSSLLRECQVRIQSPWDRFLLGSHELYIFEAAPATFD